MPISDQENDEMVESYLDEHSFEAKEWLANSRHQLIRDEPDCPKMIDAFYEAGATEVLFTKITEADGIHYAETMVVVLPEDRKLKAAVLQCGADLLWNRVKQPADKMADFGFTDTGQKYLEWGFL